MYGCLAQLVEQWTVNPCVAGSKPAAAAKKLLVIQKLFCFNPFFTGNSFMTKAEIRSIVKDKIKQTSQSLEKQSDIICSKICKSEEFEKADFLLAYMPLPDEVNIIPVIKKAFLSEKKVYVPKIIPQTNLMNFYEIQESDIQTLGAGAFGIKEPEESVERLFTKNIAKDENSEWGIRNGELNTKGTESKECSSLQTLILVPGRAFTKDGKRVGRGKGFYDIWIDRFINKGDRVNCMKSLVLAGVCFSQQLFEEVPVTENDIPMDIVFSD